MKQMNWRSPLLKRLVVPFFAVFALSCLPDTASAQTLTVSPNTITFNAASNTQVPTASGFAVNNPAGTTFTVSANQTWIVTSILGSVVQVSISPAVLATLAPGTYFGAITVTSSVSTIPPATVTVTLNVGGTGGGGGSTVSPVSVAPNALSFQSQGGSIPAQQVFNLTAPAGSSYTVVTTYASSGGWLTTTPSNGVTTGATTPITVGATPGSLPAGVYSAAIQVLISNQITQVVLVTFTIGTGGITISPNVVTFSYQPGQAVPGNQSFTITTPQNSTYVVFSNQISGGSWLNLPTTSGQTSPSAQVTVGLNATAVQSLTTGIYTTLVSVSTTLSGQPVQYVMVVLQVGTTGSGGGGGTGSQGVTFAPASLTFNFTPGQSAPANQQITVNAPQAFNITVTFPTDNGGQWLAAGPTSVQLAPSGTIFTTNIAVGVIGLVIANLPNGAYTGRLVITQTGTSNVLATVPVTLNVGAGGGGGGATTGKVSPSQLTFTYQANQSNPPTQLLTLIPAGGTPTQYTTQITGPGGAAVNWLQLEPATGTAPGAIAVRIINVGTLPPGTFLATINVTFGSSATPIAVPVTLVVQATASLRTNVTSANFNYQINGSVPAGQGATVDVTSTGGVASPVSFTTTAAMATGSGWLSVSPASGTTPSQVAISVNAGGLQPGIYTGTVTLTYAGGQNVIPVTLQVSNLPLLNSNTPSMAFLHNIGSGSPAAQNLTITTTGASATIIPTVNQPAGQNWLTVTPLQQATTPVTFQVSVNPVGLSEGIYYGSIVFSAAAAGTVDNSPLVVPVAFNVTGSASLVITPGPLTFTQFQGGAAPASQALNIASSGTLLSYTVETSILTGSGWLSVSANSGITPSSIQVTANGTQLGLGSYSGSVIIRATGASNSPQVVPITLNVVSPPSVSASPNSLTFSANTNNVVTPPTQTIEVRSTGAQITYSVQATVPSGQPQWLVVTPTTAATTPSNITVSISLTGLQPGVYNGTITINTGLPQPITIPVQLNYQQVNPPVISSVTNAASFLPTAVAPGMIVAIFGQNLGPQNLVRLRLTPAGTVDTTLETVRVTFDGIPAPLVYVRSDVVSAVVPYGIGGRSSVRLQVENQGARSAEVNVRVVDAAPAIFTVNQQGDGQGAIQNSDFSINSAGNPAVRGQFAIIYITGEGATSPAGVDGLIASTSLLRSPIGRVEVRIGGQLAEVLYAGSVPTTVLGLAQVNVIVPPNAPTGSLVPVEVSVGGVASRPGVTMAIR
jgi:uncharacterized protein (TIGR03437 family)